MSSYTPPSGDSIQFSLDGTYILPNCVDGITFNFGGAVELAIRSHNIELASELDTMGFLYGELIRSADVNINIFSDLSKLDPVWPIHSQDSEVALTLESALVRILPDIINSDIEISSSVSESTIRGTESFHLPVNSPTSMRVGFKEPEVVQVNKNIPWDTPTYLAPHKPIAATRTDRGIMHSAAVPWLAMGAFDSHYDIPNSSYKDETDKHYYVENITLSIEDQHYNIPWGSGLYLRDVTHSYPYNAPGPKDSHKNTIWNTDDTVDVTHSYPYNVPGSKDIHKNNPWGPFSYYTLCYDRYTEPPGDEIDFSFPNKYPLPDSSGDISFNVNSYSTSPRCNFRHNHSGVRDNYTPPDIVSTPNTPIYLEEYYKMNTVLVKRLPDNMPIEILSFQATIDRDSWLWQFNIVLGSREYLDLIKPDIGNADLFTDIEINVNGWKFACRVENWTEKRTFGKDTWSVTGRSPSMELGAPQNPALSYTYDASGSAESAGAQIIDDILAGTMLGLDNTGWSIDWNDYALTVGEYTGFAPYDASDWGIPANTFSWENKTQIEAIQELTNSIGVFLLTKPNCHETKELIARARYHVPPWNWNFGDALFPNIDHTISEGICREIGRSYKSLPVYTAVYTMGQNQTSPQDTNTSSGICIVQSYRTGFGPNMRTYAPNVSNPWLTAYKAAAENGRMVISETGEWVQHSIRLFSLANYDSSEPELVGLVLPGDFVQVNEKGVNFFGQAISTTINATVVNGAAINVAQTIEVNEYIGE